MNTTFSIPLTLIFALTLGLLLFASTASATVINYNDGLRVNWSSYNIVPGTCYRVGGPSASPTWTANPGSENGGISYLPRTISPGSYNFTFSCESTAASAQAGQRITAVAPLTVNPATVKLRFSSDANNPLIEPLRLSFSSNYNYLSQGGGNATLYWDFSGSYAELNGSCVASGNWSGPRPNKGSVPIYWSNPNYNEDLSKYYSITCSANGQGITRSLEIINAPRPCPQNQICEIQ